MKNWLNNYFGFTKREYNGLLVLLTLLCLITVLPYAYNMLLSPETVLDHVAQNAIQKLELAEQKKPVYFDRLRNGIEAADRTRGRRLFKFDPNEISLEQWQQLGLSAKQAQGILNYRNKGGRFYKVADLKKMYTISPEKYEELAPFVQLSHTAPVYTAVKHQPEATVVYPKKERVLIELNGADEVQLQEVKGIGPSFAKRISNYRARLGGFYQKEQLLAVYGLDSAKFNEIRDQVHVDASKIRRIPINTADFDVLKLHPYWSYKEINAIIQYRKQHGPYKGIDDLRKVVILSPQMIGRIAPYLSFTND